MVVYHIILGSTLGGHANYIVRRGGADGVDRNSVAGDCGEETAEWLEDLQLDHQTHSRLQEMHLGRNRQPLYCIPGLQALSCVRG